MSPSHQIRVKQNNCEHGWNYNSEYYVGIKLVAKCIFCGKVIELVEDRQKLP